MARLRRRQRMRVLAPTQEPENKQTLGEHDTAHGEDFRLTASVPQESVTLKRTRRPTGFTRAKLGSMLME